MFVKSVLIPKYKSYTIDHNKSVKEALEQLEANHIDGLPVLDGETYVGIVTRYGIYENYFSANIMKEDYLQNTKVKDIATHKDHYLKGNEIFENTLIDLKDFPLLAVLDEKQKFQGIVTRYDVLAQFQSAFGMNKPGIRIAFTSSEIEGRLAKLSDIAHQYHEHIISIVTFDETDKLIRRIVMKVEKNDNINQFIKKLENSGFRILDVTED
ncbi:putative transcriptional regulator [Cytobacillus eiseniae]|uniref:Transcriptional regulator n=1 Tax=Cytobacillus eiseniae TaxID=762947 RepID=A0ABS4RDC2_9BACI|nr:CBS domain-containing protein [Cytobacillus eiseniae]MBP2240709.1 putative transcriptional regulator [Cytobacillus eiseniae]